MPVIEIRTVKKYEEHKKISILKEIDKNLMRSLNLKESRFLISWDIFDFNSFLYKGTNATEENKEYPIIHIYSMEGKSKLIEKTIMDTVTKTLAEGIDIDLKSISTIFHRIFSGNIYADGSYLQIKLE